MMKGLNFPEPPSSHSRRGAIPEAKLQKSSQWALCMGGALTILAAVRVPRWTPVACFYGIPGSPRRRFKENQNSPDLPFANKDGHWNGPPR